LPSRRRYRVHREAMCCEEQSMSDHGVEPWVPPPPAAKKGGRSPRHGGRTHLIRKHVTAVTTRQLSKVAEVMAVVVVVEFRRHITNYSVTGAQVPPPRSC